MSNVTTLPIETVNFSNDIIQDVSLHNRLKAVIDAGGAVIVKDVIAPEKISQIKSYLASIGNGSLPGYHALRKGCPDFHRYCYNDERSPIKSIMSQFLFHPWNQNVFNLFDLMQSVFHIRNVISGFEKNAFLDNLADNDFVARIAFHCYHAGGGYMQKHSDPVGEHQFAAAVMQLAQKGDDYQQGGLMLWDEQGDPIDIDAMMSPGDVVYFNAQTPHSVEPIDPGQPYNPLDFNGRWMMLAAVIRTANNTHTSDAIGY